MSPLIIRKNISSHISLIKDLRPELHVNPREAYSLFSRFLSILNVRSLETMPRMTGHAPVSVIKAHYAREWLDDAVAEAHIASDKNARRREILFAVCFAENYLVEWFRDELLERAEELSKYFPPGQRLGAKEKWKEIPRQLKRDELLADTPDLGTPFWNAFCDLVDLRDWLVHGRASRPYVPGQADEERPGPGVDELIDSINAGWAVSVAKDLVQTFHKSAGTEIPKWVDVAASH
jgi:hypothetical protein